MISLETLPAYESTSAGGAMSLLPVHESFYVGCMLGGIGTSTPYTPPRNSLWRPPLTLEQTTSGAAVLDAQPAGSAIGELRRLSGLTWNQLASIFQVSRRSLHFWASGKPMAPSNEEQLQRVLAIMRKIDRGTASANRAALLGASADGSLLIDLVAAGDYDRVLALLRSGESRRVPPPKLSEEARAARAPLPPEEQVGALQDRIHRESGVFRPAKSVRVRSDR